MDFTAGETEARTHPRATTYEKPDPDPRPVLPAIPAAAGDDFQGPFTLVERKSLGQIFWGNQFFIPLDHVMCDLHSSGVGRMKAFRSTILKPVQPSCLRKLPTYPVTISWAGCKGCTGTGLRIKAKKEQNTLASVKPTISLLPYSRAIVTSILPWCSQDE